MTQYGIWVQGATNPSSSKRKSVLSGKRLTAVQWDRWYCGVAEHNPRKKNFSSSTGNRTPVSRMTGGDTNHYTTEDLNKFLSDFLLLSILNLSTRSDELKTPSDECSVSLVLYTLAQIGTQSSRFGYMGVPPIPILVPGGYMVSDVDFDWLLIFVYNWDVWVWIVTVSCPRHLYERHVLET